MRIAVTHKDGEIFSHFGQTEQFKIYQVEGKTVTDSYLLKTGTAGHDALANLLGEKEVNVLICGGIGAGAQSALARYGIFTCAGAEGSTDQAVVDFLDGQLFDRGGGCDHHHHHEEGHTCCGGNGGCCHED